MIDWLSIETAPDDTPVLVYVNGVCIEGEYSSKWTQWSYEGLDSHGCGCCAGSDPPPTHWARLNRPE